MPRPLRAIIFDIDGTLLPSTTLCRFLGRRLGHLALIEEMEAAWHAYAISNREFATRDAVNYAGRRLVDIDRHLDDLPLIDGMAETFEAIKAAGISIMLATCSWSFGARYLQRRFALDGHCGTDMAETGGILDGRVARFCDEDDKARRAARFAERLGIALADCLAVGDSRSDIPLFKLSGRAIALNARPDAKAWASEHLETEDLRAILPMLGL